MSNFEGAAGEDAYKNVAIMFSKINGTLGDVVSGNEIKGGVALVDIL